MTILFNFQMNRVVLMSSRAVTRNAFISGGCAMAMTTAVTALMRKTVRRRRACRIRSLRVWTNIASRIVGDVTAIMTVQTAPMKG